MTNALQIMAVQVNPSLFDLPWNTSLDSWPRNIIAALPRGISRHVVRFVYLDEQIIAIKEISEHTAYREYQMLRTLGRLGAPAVVPVAVVTGRATNDGKDLNAALITSHLEYSLPYRALFGQHQSPENARRLIDALSVLIVRLHLLGFFWGDISLSNTLFRRDAGEFAAYLVDAETGELYDAITDGKREYDIDVARTNIIGELMDLQASGVLREDFDPIEVGDTLVERYTSLWRELTETTTYAAGEKWKIAERIKRLNDLGFEVGELSMTTDDDGTRVSIQPKVVDAGHYKRQIMRLTGMDVQENQARRMLNDIQQFRGKKKYAHTPLSVVAHDWMTHIFEPTIAAIPPELRNKFDVAELFHQILEHRWYMSEKAKRDVSRKAAIKDFIDTWLRHQPDERSFIGQTAEQVLGPDTERIAGMTTYFS
ncbi:MAG: DUF4032 domain-containing protein [Ancrocorticia sp.]